MAHQTLSGASITEPKNKKAIARKASTRLSISARRLIGVGGRKPKRGSGRTRQSGR